MKAALGLSKFAPSRLAYELARETFLIEDLRTRLILPSTAQEAQLRTTRQEKRADIESAFYVTDAMTNRDWTGPNNKFRNPINRLAVHGFHHKFCKRAEYHDPSPICVCKLSGKECTRYHFDTCNNKKKSLLEYSNETCI